MNTLKLTSAAALIFAAAAVSVPANAEVITFEFGAIGGGMLFNPPGDGVDADGPAPDDISFTDSVGGLSLTVTGWEGVDLSTDNVGNPVSFADQEDVTRDIGGPNQGLGINSDNSDEDPDEVSGDSDENSGEALRFIFDDEVMLESIVFNNAGTNDDFDFVLGNVLELNEVDISGMGESVIFTFDTDAPGSFVNAFANSFAIGADGSNDNFKIRSITVSTRVDSVPEPAALGLLSFGLICLGLARRRRKNGRS